MALRIPSRPANPYVSLPDAVRHICGLEPTLPPSDVADALLDAIAVDELEVKNLEPFVLDAWKSDPGINWESGKFTFAGPEIPVSLRQYHLPLILLSSAVAVFEEKPARGEVKRSTGPQPTTRDTIKSRILDALRSGRVILDANHDALTEEFGGGASRGTCVAALREALSEFDGQKC